MPCSRRGRTTTIRTGACPRSKRPSALQGDHAVDDRLHLDLFEAFFTKSHNIARADEVIRTAIEQHGVQGIPTVIVPESNARVVGLADLETYRRMVFERGGPTTKAPRTPSEATA
jgi:hypothetical protein